MCNYIEYKDTITFHLGFYINEMLKPQKFETVNPMGSIDIAMKLSRMLGTSFSYWLNLQNSYDSVFKSKLEMKNF